MLGTDVFPISRGKSKATLVRFLDEPLLCPAQDTDIPRHAMIAYALNPGFPGLSGRVKHVLLIVDASAPHGISGTGHGTSGTESRCIGNADFGTLGTKRRDFGNAQNPRLVQTQRVAPAVAGSNSLWILLTD